MFSELIELGFIDSELTVHEKGCDIVIEKYFSENSTL